jgi:hypothetical protein
VREMVAPDDHGATESPTPEVTVTVAVDLAMEVAEISTAAAFGSGGGLLGLADFLHCWSCF